MRFQTTLLGLALSYCLGLELAADTGSNEIPFRLHRGHLILVEGALFDHPDTLKMIIDTGSNYSVISSKTADKLGLIRALTSSTTKSYGKPKKTERTVLRGLKVGPLLVTIPCFITDLPWNGVDMIVGLDVLRRANLTIDYGARIIRFGSRESFEFRVPFQTREEALLITEARIGNRVVRLSIDSGAVQTSLYRNQIQSWIKRLGGSRTVTIHHAAGSSDAKTVRLPEFQLGPDRWDELKALVLDAAGTSERSGVLSLAGLGLRRVHIDFESAILSWER